MKRSKNFTITHDMLKDMALKVAKKLSILNFKASNGWIDLFKKRNKISSKAIVGESGLVNDEFLKPFNHILNQKLFNYDNKNIFNCDETGLFIMSPIQNTYMF